MSTLKIVGCGNVGGRPPPGALCGIAAKGEIAAATNEFREESFFALDFGSAVYNGLPRGRDTHGVSTRLPI